ncbi:acetamidase/formamidase family protein [Halobacillus amylolyticus]|uniref:Acetamidase/formamidase family protein n=1 Tax=Halobacillus amylolyticus TaxID=2932259 RepID=A0ABY4HBI2_9BACI|nr:acetamidase/formamidase family protein [Halobacillus amylolyticus]UOR11613.1 acetamidase/formamidase family protein [Halobacillus amylolyticus]
MVHTLAKESFVYAMSKENKPALKVTAGEQVVIDTYDCFENQIQSEDASFTSIDWERINPATGPVYVDGAQTGDILKVKIDHIELGERGVMATGPKLGVMGHRIEDFQVKMVEIKGNEVVFNDNISLPLQPMIGVIGVAPEDEAVSCGTPGAHGGNMDTKLVTTGATLYLPVFQEGGLFALGDLHAAMGDGEVCVSGVEIPAKVTVTLDVIKGHSIDYPFIENEAGAASLVSRESLDEASDLAVEKMIDVLQPQTDLSLAEFTMLMSAAGEVQVSQIVDPLKTARFFVPRRVLDGYGIKLFK